MDPALEAFSPHLAYFRQTPQENGAQLFLTKTRRVDIRWATAMSAQRRKLYQEGRYQPRTYAYVWPRRSFLNWIDTQRDC